MSSLKFSVTDEEITDICVCVRKINRAFDPTSHEEAAGTAEGTGRIVAAIIMAKSKGDKE